MKTLIIISHPEIKESSSQQYLLHSIPDDQDVTIHHLEGIYSNTPIDVANEQKLLAAHDRIIFQFPLYWYSSPALLKQWQDEVLTDDFAYGKKGNQLQNKEFALVLLIGAAKTDYQAGGKELYSIDELTKPFQAMAHKTGMKFLKIFAVHQFVYMTEEEKMTLLIDYQLFLTHGTELSLFSREKWLLNQLEKTNVTSLGIENEEKLQYVIEMIEENRETIDDLKLLIDDMN
ncbi:NAD(P)H-dependent oxidoreductase [Carnobacterium funditum]|uniref:NAD(P)H-dependent oxidoreductase n=1 Tax=Carnobacterium funditum TaxID=2752 RepID=UPI0005576ED4|nr:NAD(P)H-dependent oxidoreductase [Carnobacterium funditum]